MRRLSGPLVLVAVVLVGLTTGGLRTAAQDASPMAGMTDIPAGSVGLTPHVLARVEPAAAGQELQLVRVDVAPGATVAPHTHPGTIALGLESGSFNFGIVKGTATVTRAATAATPEAAEQL